MVDQAIGIYGHHGVYHSADACTWGWSKYGGVACSGGFGRLEEWGFLQPREYLRR